MISLAPLIQHLKIKPADFDQLWFRSVAGAAEYAQVDPAKLPLPAAWIVRAAEREEGADAEFRASNVTLAFDVVIAVSNLREQRAGEMDDKLLAYRQAVKNRLMGWEIEPGVRPLQFRGGRVLEYTNADMYWADRYQFEALIENYLPDPPPYDNIIYTGDSL